MKKKSKILSIFIMLFAIVFEVFVGTQTNVSAEDSGGDPILNEKVFYESSSDTHVGNVTITPQGEIAINYQYGFTELLVTVKKCQKYNADTLEEATACEQFSSDDDIIILHLSGSYVKNPATNVYQTKKIHLLNQDFLDYDEIVQIAVYTDFFNTARSNPVALYCNPDAGFKCSTDGDVDSKEASKKGQTSDVSIKARFGVSEADIKFQDKSRVIYQGDGENNTPVTSPLSVGVFEGQASIGSINNLTIIKVDNSKFTDDDGEMQDMIYDTIIPVLIGILLTAAGVSIMVLGYQIVKSADEGQERHEKVVRLRNILIGIGIAVLLLAVVGPLSGVVEEVLFKD